MNIEIQFSEKENTIPDIVAENNIKVSAAVYALTQIEGAENYPDAEKSDFHKDDKYWCMPFYKTISRFSKFI